MRDLIGSVKHCCNRFALFGLKYLFSKTDKFTCLAASYVLWIFFSLIFAQIRIKDTFTHFEHFLTEQDLRHEAFVLKKLQTIIGGMGIHCRLV
jgi:hypothetical protein